MNKKETKGENIEIIKKVKVVKKKIKKKKLNQKNNLLME